MLNQCFKRSNIILYSGDFQAILFCPKLYRVWCIGIYLIGWRGSGQADRELTGNWWQTPENWGSSESRGGKLDGPNYPHCPGTVQALTYALYASTNT